MQWQFIDFHFTVPRISCLWVEKIICTLSWRWHLINQFSLYVVQDFMFAWIGEVTCTLFLDVIDIGRSPHSGCVWIFCKKFIEKTNSNQCWDARKMFIWILKGLRVECERIWEFEKCFRVSNSLKFYPNFPYHNSHQQNLWITYLYFGELF